jgi:ABC-type uncharacterized transport system permease subunit
MSRTIRESEYFLAWLVFWLSATVGGFVLGAIIGAILGFALSVAGADLQIIKIVCGIAGFIIAIPLSYLLFRLIVGTMIVRKSEGRLTETT